MVIAGTAVESHLCSLLAGDNPKAVVLDFVQPLAAGRQFRGFGREERQGLWPRISILLIARLTLSDDGASHAFG